ncbi:MULTISPECIES: malonate transporter subunit MadM [unclassified Halanaerobium]|uniref:malonate transporter subunit MadM n=1 Tax=unclassified Halanaerobium TaxID=2641197 RepID=UPI000DF2ED3A|nr:MULTISPECIES: malonate transporter subunit MadM [unclassified Halanaerobium]RCW46634.1 malonate transporter MadM subunit [Halanaerobium sp. MA284_MarDTE_T2]RCW83482.1 malonate transporter MadM subunit [Halanaerobium sp. DL-01]
MFQAALESFMGADHLIIAIALVAFIMLITKKISKMLGEERIASALAIITGLILAYIGGRTTGGDSGLADVYIFGGASGLGVGLLGGSMIRDYTIISTAYGVKTENLKKAGPIGVISLFIGVIFSFIVGALIARILGYTNPAEITTIGAGAVTFIVGPVTGTSLGVSSDIIALSVAAGLVKSILTMIITPFIADLINLDNPTAAMVYGALIGTTSGVAGGLAATDKELVPYGAMTATFYTGLGTLLVPSVGFLLMRMLFA